MRRLGLLALLLAARAGPARVQTMLDQEQRLIEINSLLVALPALEAPGALRPRPRRHPAPGDDTQLVHPLTARRRARGLTAQSVASHAAAAADPAVV